MISTSVYTRHLLTLSRPTVSFEKNQVTDEAREKPAVIVEAGLQPVIGLIIPPLFYAVFRHELTI